ncbi:major facilitator superfamily protein [Sarocladium implicatum]|nr:major facilitator superfamily protein [Sarocladium implicatum]
MSTTQTSTAVVERDEVALQDLPSSRHRSVASASLSPTRSGDGNGVEIDALPPTDHGKGAYTALACCTLAQAPIWGYSVSFGIFQEHFTSLGTLDASPGAIATIGACQQGITYLLMPVIFLTLTRYPYLRMYCGSAGLAFTFGGLAASAFVDSVAALIATQGVLYAIGCSLLFSPISIYLNEWFVERKGFAHGVMWAGKSTVGVVAPFVFDAMLRRVGYKATMLGWTGTSLLLILPTMIFLKPRIPVSRTARGRPVSFSFTKRAAFWMTLGGVVIQAVGYLMPTTYLASYAINVGHSSITAPILLALVNLMSAPGGVLIGLLGDQFGASMAIITASFGGTLPVFLLWGLSFRLANLVVFVLLYGFFAGAFSSTWSCVMQELARNDNGAEASVIFGFLLGGRGIGFVLAGPVSGALLSIHDRVSEEALGYATRYGPMIIFTGITAVLGAWGPMWKGVHTVTKKMQLQCTGAGTR